MVDDIMLQETAIALVGSKPGDASARAKQSTEKLRPLTLEHDAAIIRNSPPSMSGIVVPQKMGLDKQQVNDLKLQIELGAQVARICQRLR